MTPASLSPESPSSISSSQHRLVAVEAAAEHEHEEDPSRIHGADGPGCRGEGDQETPPSPAKAGWKRQAGDAQAWVLEPAQPPGLPSASPEPPFAEPGLH